MMSEDEGNKYQHGAEKPQPKPSTGKPLKVLSTSLGLMLAGHLLLAPGIHAETANGTAPQLVEWSSDEVKAYFNPSIDWNIPVPFEKKEGQASPTPSATPASGGTSNGSAPVIIQNNGGYGGGFGGGFGWDDLLLYHMIFNSGSLYSSSNWVNSRPSYDYRTNTPYVPKTYSDGSFTNRPTTKTPTTNSGTGSFTTNKSSSSSSASSNSNSSSSSSSKSTSSSSGSIGGNSSGFSSSSSSGG